MNFKFSLKKLEVLPEFSMRKMPDLTIDKVVTYDSPDSHSISFCKKWDEDMENKYLHIQNSFLIVKTGLKVADEIKKRNFIFETENPRLLFAKVLNIIFADFDSFNPENYISDNFNIVRGKNALIGENTTIEPNVFIDNDVRIGKNCFIQTGVRIKKNTVIGDNVIIRENSVIGSPGFGMERDGEKIIRIPHIGGVVIGNDVEIGALNTIIAGTINPTEIHDYVKTDTHIHIAHNCIIKKAAILTACAELSGSVTIGEKTWLGPNCSIMNGIEIGKNCLVGLGAVVTKSFKDEGLTLAGNPAKKIEDIRKQNRQIKKLIRSIEDEE